MNSQKWEKSSASPFILSKLHLCALEVTVLADGTFVMSQMAIWPHIHFCRFCKPPVWAGSVIFAGGLKHRAKSSVFWRFAKSFESFMMHLGIKEKYEYIGIKMAILWDLLIVKLLCQISWRDQWAVGEKAFGIESRFLEWAFTPLRLPLPQPP